MIPLIAFLAEIDLASTKFENKSNNSISDFAITRLHDGSLEAIIKDERFNFHIDNYRTSTLLAIDENCNQESSTWENILEEDYDMISKIQFKSNTKVRVKIKSISKFVPNIVID